ncbi:MAG: fimbrillin family protein [Paraprevotella sp.]|nr:fimbrillin family protein [Paraprevotella sp.]
MHYIKKTVFVCLMTAATCAFYACTSDSPDLVSPEDYHEMRFVAADVSRSIVSGINYAGSCFALFGDMKHSGDSPVEIFHNTEVKYDGSAWNYAGTQYWFPNHEHSFVALYPYPDQSDPISSDSVYNDLVYRNSKLSFKYSLPLSDNQSTDQNKKGIDPSKLTDIIVATHRRMYYEGSSNLSAPVSLKFFHILSMIDFRLKNDNFADALRVTKIELEEIDRTGAFSITPASLSSGAQTSDYNCYWTDISNRGTVTANIDAYISRNEDLSIFADDEALLMIPQPDNKGVIVKITYTIINDNKDDKEVTLIVETPIGGWEMGKRYIYAVNVEERYITFTVTVVDWKDGTENDYMVPRK